MGSGLDQICTCTTRPRGQQPFTGLYGIQLQRRWRNNISFTDRRTEGYRISSTCQSRLVQGEEHVKKLFSTAVIVNEDTHSNLVRGHCFTGEDTNIFHPWSLKLEGFFRKSTSISFYMVTNLFIYTTGSSHIIDDRSRAVCFCQSFIAL